MSITDELRKWGYGFCGSTYEVVNAIADRIDAEHQKAIRELNNLADASVLLPVDADGVPIRVGDVMRHLGCVNTETVRGIGYNTFFTRDNHGEFYRHPASTYVHYHEPTVEDVLEEYRVRYYDLVTDMECENITNDEYAQGIKSLNDEYAAKLRLTDDRKEQ